MNTKHIAAILLAAGKGKRMNSKDVNKVTLKLAEKSMILYGIELLETLKAHPLVVVVGFARESVERVLKGRHVIFAYQDEQLGTAHATQAGVLMLPKAVQHVIVCNGDDLALYSVGIFKKLLKKHLGSHADVTFLTVTVSDPSGLGRVVRDKNGTVNAVIEDKNATYTQKKISEINTNCYVFSVDFLRKYLSKIRRNPVSYEYYLTDIIGLATKDNKNVQTVAAGSIPWRGVNTKEELSLAEHFLILQKNKHGIRYH